MMLDNSNKEFIITKSEGMKPVSMRISNRDELRFHLTHMKMVMPPNGDICFSYDMIPDIIIALQKIYENEVNKNG